MGAGEREGREEEKDSEKRVREEKKMNYEKKKKEGDRQTDRQDKAPRVGTVRSHRLTKGRGLRVGRGSYRLA